MYIIGRALGLFLFSVIVAPMRLIFRKRDCAYHNTQALHALRGKQFIAVSNHIKPRNKFLQWISMPYDAYIIRRMLQQYDIYATAFTSYDALGSARSAFGKFMQTHFKEPLVKGIVKSLDLIPLNRKKHDPTTLRNMKKRLGGQGICIGLFPEGTWFRGFRTSRKMAGGMAVFSKRYNLPILPLYLNAYNLKGDIDVRIGNLIEDPEGQQAVVEKVRHQLHAMSDHDWDQLDLNYDQTTDAQFNNQISDHPEKKSQVKKAKGAQEQSISALDKTKIKSTRRKQSTHRVAEPVA